MQQFLVNDEMVMMNVNLNATISLYQKCGCS